MTAIKQTSVMSKEHLQNLKRYFDWDREKVLEHDTQHIIDEDRWFEEMDATREAAGHNRPGKQGARCTYMQHQVIGFNPDECSCNGGPARAAAKSRVRTVKELDTEYGLRQLERGLSNSKVHARQPGREEREMAKKGRSDKSENARVRAIIAQRAEEVGRLKSCPDRFGEFARRLESDGIEVARSKQGALQYRYRSESLGKTRKINGARLGYAVNRSTGRIMRFTARGIDLAMRAAWELAREGADDGRGRD